MKVDIRKIGGGYNLEFKPEGDLEKNELKEFAESLQYPKTICCRGIKYMTKDVDFLITDLPRND